MRYVVEGALIDIVEQGCLYSILVRKVDRLDKSTPFVDALMRRLIRDTSFIKSIAPLIKEHVDRILEEVQKTLKQQLTKTRMMQISPLRLSAMSSKVEFNIPTPPERQASSDSKGEKE